MDKIKILLIEDDPLTQSVSKRTLSKFGVVCTASTFSEASVLIESASFDIAFIDINLNGVNTGIELVKLASDKKIYSVVLSGETEKLTIQTAFKNGAKDYILKPFSDEKLNQVWSFFRNSLKHLTFDSIINEKFKTASFRQIEELNKIKNLTISEKPIFLNGETGTGKRVAAHIIKEISGCSNFVEINCSQFTDELIASELFGHKKGSFTGANDNKDGLLLKANGGIIFLDEIHALSLKSQKTLLKAIEEKEFYPVGSLTSVKSNFRLISATCENIEELISQGKFRQDLFARISTFQVALLPLRERREDIELLLNHYISKHLVQIFITDEVKSILKKYTWPRNVREIEDLVENWIVNGQRLITPDELPIHIRNNTPNVTKFIPDLYMDMVDEYGLNDLLTYIKKEMINESMKRNGGSLRKTAKSLNVSYTGMFNFLKQNKSMNLTLGVHK